MDARRVKCLFQFRPGVAFPTRRHQPIEPLTFSSKNPLLVNNARPNNPLPLSATRHSLSCHRPAGTAAVQRRVSPPKRRLFWFNRAHILTPCWPTTGSHRPSACPPTACVGPVSHCRCEEQPPPPTHLCCAACRQPAGRGLLFGLIERTSGTGVGRDGRTERRQAGRTTGLGR